MRWVPYGPHALMFYFADTVGEEAFLKGRAIADDLERNPPEGLIDFVTSFTSVLLQFDPARVPQPRLRALEWTARLKSAMSGKPGLAEIKSIPVVYDGPDLQRVAQLASLSIEATIQRHSSTIYKVYALGFAPGFAYLGDLDLQLHTPRLNTPRPRIPAGSVGIGGEHTGIYPQDTAGGWNLIGRTSSVLFDPGRITGADNYQDAFLLHPGDRVQFIPQRSTLHER